MMHGFRNNGIAWLLGPGLMCMILLLTSCGLNGDLYLPDDEPQIEKTSLPKPTKDEDDSDERNFGSAPNY